MLTQFVIRSNKRNVRNFSCTIHAAKIYKYDSNDSESNHKYKQPRFVAGFKLDTISKIYKVKDKKSWYYTGDDYIIIEYTDNRFQQRIYKNYSQYDELEKFLEMQKMGNFYCAKE